MWAGPNVMYGMWYFRELTKLCAYGLWFKHFQVLSVPEGRAQLDYTISPDGFFSLIINVYSDI